MKERERKRGRNKKSESLFVYAKYRERI